MIQTKPVAEQITPLVQRDVESEEEEELIPEEEILEEKDEEPIQFKANSKQTPLVTPQLESRINNLKGGGQSLPKSVRNEFEPRLGHDFSRVRVHADTQAAELTKMVNAQAFTNGQNIVFGAGHYAPKTPAGQRLIAHELTHVIQQSAIASNKRLNSNVSNALLFSEQKTGVSVVPGRIMQRACISGPECKPLDPKAPPGTTKAQPGSAVKGSATHFVHTVKRETKVRAQKEGRKTPREIREGLCNITPPDPRCTSDGHGRRAKTFEALFGPLAPAQLKFATGIFVDKDMEKEFGAYVQDCRYFTPEIKGDKCIFIPERLENEAVQYKSNRKTIAGKDREAWLTNTLSLVTHEVEHVRFAKQFPKTAAGTCKFEDVSHELSELAAIMSEFTVVYRAFASKSWHARRSALDRWFKSHITQPSAHGERIAGILKAIRCRCECADVDTYVKRVTEFTTASWTKEEKNTFHTELRDPKWKLDWPIKTPLPPRDIPGVLLTPSLRSGYAYFGSSGLATGLGLDVGVPLDRLGKWQMLVGAQGRVISALTGESQTAYLLGLKVGFLRGPALGTSGLKFGAFGEVGGGFFERGTEKGGGAYAGGGLSLRYGGALVGLGSLMPFISAEVMGGARIDMAKPEVQKWFTAGFAFGAEF